MFSQIQDASDREAQIVSLSYNDFLKILENQDMVRKHTGSISVDHDVLLEEAFTKLPKTIFDQMFPTYSKLDKKTQAKVKTLLTAGGNIAQLGQLESVAYEAKELSKLNKHNFKSQLLHIIGDVMGAAGSNTFVAFVEAAAVTYQNIEKAYEIVATCTKTCCVFKRSVLV